MIKIRKPDEKLQTKQESVWFSQSILKYDPFYLP